jgi:hypothetical protein
MHNHSVQNFAGTPPCQPPLRGNLPLKSTQLSQNNIFTLQTIPVENPRISSSPTAKIELQAQKKRPSAKLGLISFSMKNLAVTHLFAGI